VSATLYALALSPPSLAARCMLEHKRIDHRVVDIVPGMQPVVLRARRFPHHTVPALVVDGRRIQGSREIARALEQLRGDPPLFPSHAEARRRVEEAERWGEQVLQPMPRRIFRWMAAREYVVRRWLAVEAAAVPLGAVFARPSLQARLFARASKADDAAVRADLAAIGDRLAEVERLRGAGVIGGAERNAADFQIASSLRSIAGFGDLAPYLEHHPAIRWAETVVPALPGPVPPALPRDWLRPLERV
jgi:glutathione S-transferase